MASLREREISSNRPKELAANSLERGFWIHPFKLALGNEPKQPLENALLKSLVADLINDGSITDIVDLPNKDTPPDKVPQMIIINGNGWDTYCTDSFKLYKNAPNNGKPRFFMLNFSPELPESITLDTTRQQLARSACHEGVVFIGDPENGVESVKAAIWISMQRNYRVFEGTPDEIIKQVSERILYHFGTDYMDQRKLYEGEDGPTWLKWEEWKNASFHKEMKNFAVALYKARIISNEVDLRKYCQDNKRHAEIIYRLINKTLGESMMGIGLGDFRVYAVSSSGANKATWDPDPMAGYLVPVSHITGKGYLIMRPNGTPEVVTYGEPSVESREGALAQIAKQLVDRGIVRDFEGFYRWHENTFADPNMIMPVFLPGVEFPGLVIEHNHNHVVRYNPAKVEVAIPDESLFTSADQPCGSEGGQWSLLQGLFKLRCFTSRGTFDHPLSGRVGVVQFPGHGMVVVAENIQSAQDALLNAMELAEPPPA